MRAAALLALVLTTGCSLFPAYSDKNFVAGADAAYLWHEGRFEDEYGGCPAVSPPVTDCEKLGDKLRSAKKMIQRANRVQKVGKLPREARREVRRRLKEVRDAK